MEGLIDLRRSRYQGGWYCSRCGTYNYYGIEGILPAYKDKSTLRQWDSNVKCVNCPQIARIYRTEKHVVEIRQI